MDDRTKHEHVRDGQGTHPQHPPLAFENAGTAGTSGVKGKSGTGGPPPSSPSDDDEARANSELLNAWMQRLQILTVATTFLASMDGQLFSLTALNTQIGLAISTTARELVYACLAGALIFHICAAVLGYAASFALIRYRIVDASDEDGTKVGNMLFFKLVAAQPAQRPSRRIVLEPVRPLHWLATFLQHPERLRLFSTSQSPRLSTPPLTALTRCYHTTLCLAAVGFILAITGILSYVWSGLPVSVGIFSTACLGVGISAGMWAIAI